MGGAKREQRRRYAVWAVENPEWAGTFRFLASDLAMLGQAYVVFLASGMSLDPDDPADMRWWAAALLLLAGGFGLLAAAGHYHTWVMGLAVLLALLTGSVAVAVAGPLGDGRARPGGRDGPRPGDARSRRRPGRPGERRDRAPRRGRRR